MNGEQRVDYILKEIENKKSPMGSLKIFFGYAAGVGKTYAMLEAAHEVVKRNIDVVVGYVEPHARPDTMYLMNGLECIQPQTIQYNGINLKEFDLDAALKRKPQLILVDELAHTNVPGSRHKKRYQDVQELLKAGIDVYTTVNVQHIESLNDIVSSITGITVNERIPDSIFDQADQVEIIDIEPKDLLHRLEIGKIYGKNQAKQAMNHFFTLENLTALREISLRRCADQVNLASEVTGIKSHDDYHTDEHILVCLSSSPSNAKIIRTAARMANAFKGSFTAIFVETSDFENMSQEDLTRLRKNLRLAEQLGAKIEAVYGDDVPYQIAEFARLSGVSKIVIGRSTAKPRFWETKTLTEKLINYSLNLDIYIIPDTEHKTRYYPKHRKKKEYIRPVDGIKSIFVLIVASIIATIFDYLGFAEANIIIVYVLAVLIISIITVNRWPSLVSSVFSVLIYNFLFTDPRYSLMAYDKGYPITFIIMFFAAFITSTLAVRLKEHAKQSTKVAVKMKLLFDMNQSLQKAKNKKEIMNIVGKKLKELLNKDILMYPVENNELLEPEIFYVHEQEPQEDYLIRSERTVALWVFKNNKHAGASTETLSNAKCLYLAIRFQDRVYGVVGIGLGKDMLDTFEKGILLSILSDCALALENKL